MTSFTIKIPTGSWHKLLFIWNLWSWFWPGYLKRTTSLRQDNENWSMCGRSVLACHITTALTIYLMIPFVSEVCWLISNRCEEKKNIHVLIQVWFRKYCLGKMPKCNQTLSGFLSWESFDNMFYSFYSTSSLKGRSG